MAELILIPLFIFLILATVGAFAVTLFYIFLAVFLTTIAFLCSLIFKL